MTSESPPTNNSNNDRHTHFLTVPGSTTPVRALTLAEPPPPPVVPSDARPLSRSSSSAGRNTKVDSTIMSKSPKEKQPKKASKTARYCKAPQAPKRFKSAFIFFTMERHAAIRKKVEEDNGKGDGDRLPHVAKLVSKEWRNMGREERAVWDEKARVDRKRYEFEKSMYAGPWKIPVKSRKKKDPSAPKRPMSSFLSFSNSRRGSVKRKNPDLDSPEISKLLAEMWRNAPGEERKDHIERAEQLNEVYNVEMSAWRERTKKEEVEKRERREEAAKRIIEEEEAVESIMAHQGEQYLGIVPLRPPYHPSQPMMYGHFPPSYRPPHSHSSYPPRSWRGRGRFSGPLRGGRHHHPPPYPSHGHSDRGFPPQHGWEAWAPGEDRRTFDEAQADMADDSDSGNAATAAQNIRSSA